MICIFEGDEHAADTLDSIGSANINQQQGQLGEDEPPLSEPSECQGQTSFDQPSPSSEEVSNASYHSIGEDQQINVLKQYHFFLLRVHLKQGYDLVARDSNGKCQNFEMWYVTEEDHTLRFKYISMLSDI